jgi:hypothetical protein
MTILLSLCFFAGISIANETAGKQDVEAIVSFINQADEVVSIAWIGNADTTAPMGEVKPGLQLELRSFVGHRFDAFNSRRNRLGTFLVQSATERFVVRRLSSNKKPLPITVFDRVQFMSELLLSEVRSRVCRVPSSLFL